MPRYYVTTWDADRQAFTPQSGVRTGPYSLFGLRKALRKLRSMGYSARKGDPSVLVESPERVEEAVRAFERIAREA